jgi:hypothetical protein
VTRCKLLKSLSLFQHGEPLALAMCSVAWTRRFGYSVASARRFGYVLMLLFFSAASPFHLARCAPPGLASATESFYSSEGGAQGHEPQFLVLQH